VVGYPGHHRDRISSGCSVILSPLHRQELLVLLLNPLVLLSIFMSSSSRSRTVRIDDGSHLPVVGQDTLLSDSFSIPDVSYVPDLTMKLMLLT
jgi:hypothetical protein